MKIIIDGSCYLNRRGYGRVTRQLIEIAPEAFPDDEVIIYDPDSVIFSKANVYRPKGLMASKRITMASDGNRSTLDLIRGSYALCFLKPDVVIFPSPMTYYPTSIGVRTILIQHDVLSMMHPSLYFGSFKSYLKARIRDWYANRTSSITLGVSLISTAEIQSYYQLDAHRLDTWYSYVEPIFFSEDTHDKNCLLEYGIPDGARYLLTVGGPSLNKNIECLIKAFSLIEDDSLWLIIVADLNEPFHNGLIGIKRVVHDSCKRDKIILTGYLPDKKLASLYKKASLFVFPSLAEGFGLPPLEAMACGAPVLVHPLPVYDETLSEAARRCDCSSSTSLAHAIKLIITDENLCESLKAGGPSQANKFTKQNAVRHLYTLVKGDRF